MEIIWSKLAQADYDENIAYLLDECTVADARRFVRDVEDTIIQIKSNPESFPETNHKGVRGGPIIPQVSIFYSLDLAAKKIEIIRFWNNYQNPDKLKIG